MYVDGFPGPLNNLYIYNLTKVQETKFPAGVLEGAKPLDLVSTHRYFPPAYSPKPSAAPGRGPYFFACRLRSAMVARLVTCSGFILISIIAGFFEAEARL